MVGKDSTFSIKNNFLASRYVANPHLINDLKYDLRVYVLVTCFDPLRVYMYKDGLVRFATTKYTNDLEKLQEKFVHLTNFSINKKSENFVSNNCDEEGEESSSKWNFATLKAAFDKRGLNFNKAFAHIKDLIIKTLISVHSHISQ